MKDRVEILASGFGGQGVVRLGQILGMAAVKQGFRVTMLKSHGTEQRGGYVRTQIVVSRDEIDSPLVESADYFCCLSKAAYKMFAKMVTQGGLLIYDPAFVEEIDASLPIRHVAIAANDTATKELGRPIYANSIMAGALAKAIDFLDKDILLETTLSVIPKFKEENRKAFEIGYGLMKA
jgi:2-oxoglutarate ferredoxin oxidoreductase subunit gamma